MVQKFERDSMFKIGGKIRNLRLKNNMTQSELADRSELSKGFISQLESDQTSPSLSTLEDILSSLGTNFKEFFNDDYQKIVYRDEDVFVKEFADYQISWLIADAQKNEMEPIMLVLNGNAQTEEHSPHSGEEFGYVFSGRVSVYVGDACHKAKAGECFYFKAALPHYIKNNGKLPAKVLWVSTPPTF